MTEENNSMTKGEFYHWQTPRSPGFLNTRVLLKNAAISYPDKLVIDANMDIHRSYRDVDERARRISNGLLARNKPGDFVAILSRVGAVESIELLFGIYGASMTAIPLSYRLKPSEIENVLKYTNARALIFDEKFKPIVDQISLDIDTYMFGLDPQGDYSFNELLQHGAGQPDVAIYDHTPACLGFTSGTTGAPKAYIRSHYANVVNALSYVECMDFTSSDVIMNCIPPLTGLGLNTGAIAARATIINIDFNPAEVLAAIEKYKPTYLYSVPAMYAFMMEVPDFDKYDLSSLRAVGSVGAPLPKPALEKIWQKICPNLYDHLGMQEVGFIAVSKPDMKRMKPNSVGPPTMYTEHRIVDGVGNELPVGEVGEITVRYPDGAGEYWKDPIKTAECIKNGWFYTGDLGKLDEQGFLYIVGRAKDMIVSGGYNVFAVDVENVLLSHLKISDAAVVGLPDEKWGEKVAAVVVLKPNESVTEDEIMEFCKERMAGYKAPKKIIFEDIPRNLAGKVLKYKIVAKYAAA